MGQLTNDEKVQILKDIVEIQTVNDNEIEVAEYLKDLFSKHDIDSEIIKLKDSDTRANLVAEIGSGKPVVGVSGHMDVVTTGDESTWNYEPFKLTEDDQGLLHGRGSADMKSGLAALAISLIELKEADALSNGTIRFMATAGEEVTSSGAALLHEQGYMDDVDALLIAEPSQDGIVYAHKGTMDIELTSIGKSSHSSLPELGFNAITPVVNFIYHLNAAYADVDVENKLVGKPVMSATVINGGDQVNSIPDKTTVLFNMRTVPEYDNEKFIDLFESIKEKVSGNGEKLSIDPYVNRDPIETTGDNKLIDLAQELGKKYFDKDIEKTSSTATTDASFLMKDKDKDFTFVMFGPGETGQAHQVDEYVDKEVYLTFIDLYQELLSTYLNEDK